MGFWAIAIPAVASLLSAGIAKSGGSKNKAQSKAVTQGAQAETALKEQQLALSQAVAELIMGRLSGLTSNQPAILPGKLGGGLGANLLGKIASSVPLGTLLGLPGTASSGSGATSAAAGLTAQASNQSAAQSAALGQNLATIIASLIGSQEQQAVPAGGLDPMTIFDPTQGGVALVNDPTFGQQAAEPTQFDFEMSKG